MWSVPKWRYGVLGAAAVLAMLTTGGLLWNARAESNVPTSPKTVQQTPPPPQHWYRALDGVEVASSALTHPAPVGMMIENLTVVRPQHGLSAASVVYEALAEGGVTRFLAVFPGAGGKSLEKIGPVRSARPYYLQWFAEYSGLYGHAGGSPRALEDIRNDAALYTDFNGIGSAGKYFWRDRSTWAPHNLFTSSAMLALAIRDLGFEDSTLPKTGWQFKDDRLLDARPADGQFVRIGFSGKAYETEYRYHRDTNTYLRFNGGQEHLDAENGEQIRVKNVVVQYIPPIVNVGEKGRLTLEVEGTGKALFFIDGGANLGTWQKAGKAERTRFFLENGQEVTFSRGNTWIAVIPETQVVEYGAPAG